MIRGIRLKKRLAGFFFLVLLTELLDGQGGYDFIVQLSVQYRTGRRAAGPFRISMKCDLDRLHRFGFLHRLTDSPWATGECARTRCNVRVDAACGQ